MTEPFPDAPGPDTSPRSLLDTAARIGEMVWVEQRAFEVLSGWSREPGDAEAQVLYATGARHHAWRADQLAERFPAIADLVLADRLAPPAGGVAALFEALAELDAASPVDRLAGVYRVLLPQVLADHEVDLARSTEVADAPLRRTLRQVIADEGEDLAAGEAVLQARLDADADADLGRAPSVGVLVARLTGVLDAVG